MTALPSYFARVRRPRPVPPRGAISLLDAVIFAIPALQFWQIALVGRLFVTDLMLLALFGILVVLRGRQLWQPLPKRFLTLGVLWLAAQIVTDLIRHTPFEDYARGWAKIALTVTHFCVLYLLLHGRPRRIVAYALGLVVGGFLGYWISPSEYASADPWKFGTAYPTTLAVFLLMILTEQRLLQAAAAIGIAALNMVMGFRSLGGVCFLAAVYLVMQWLWARGEQRGMRPSLGRMVFVGGLICAAGWGLLQAYEYAAAQGELGEQARYKYEVQGGGRYGLLLGGRTEILISLQAIADSPLIGHGSWAKDPAYAAAYTERAALLGYGSGAPPQSDLIPTHSHLFGAWVEAGFVGAVFWAWVLTLVARVMGGLYRTRDRFTPLGAFCAFALTWDIFFSPYGAAGRFLVPFYVVVLMTLLSARERWPLRAAFAGRMRPWSWHAAAGR